MLNRKGEVLYNQTGSVTPEMLAALYKQADESVPAAPQAVPSEADGEAENTTVPDAGVPAAEAGFESSAPVGSEVGQQLEDFSVTTFDGSEFHLADTRGKVTFINLWATYCTPCVQELPEFEKLCEAHEGDIAMLAVHSSLTGEVEPQDYVASKGWENWAIPFTLDDDDDTLFGIVNGGATLPQTIVLNRFGEVIYNQVGSVTPEMLEHLYKQASQ